MGISEYSASLDALVKSSPQSSDPRLRPLLQGLIPISGDLLSSRSGTAAAHFKCVGRSLLRIRGSAHASLRLALLDDCCRHMYLTGRAAESLELAQSAFELARRSGKVASVRKFLCILALLHGEMGNACQAIELQVSAVMLADQVGDQFGRYVSWSNLAALLVDSGLYREAVACASRALELIDSSRPELDNERARILTNLSLATLRLGNTLEAEEAARKSLELSAPPATHDGAVARLVRELNYFMALTTNGRHPLARECARHMEDLATQFPSARTCGTARFCMGLNSVYLGEVDPGIRVATEAARSFKGAMTPMYVDALCLLTRMYGDLDRPHEALEVLEELLDHLENAASAVVLAGLKSIGVPRVQDNASRSKNLREHEIDKAVLRARVSEIELCRTRQEMLERMAVAADIREDISGEHGYRVGCLSSLLASEIGWSREACSAIDLAARLHDIGKIGIPERILFDEKTLREVERHFIASHTLVGAEILSKSRIPQVRIAEEIARYHHEWWDGTGYPKGLRERAIPISARIVALADAFDAMTHGRPYATAISVEDALEQITTLRGRQFDPELADHFLALIRRLVAANEDLDAFLGRSGRNSPFLTARARIKEMLAQGRDLTSLPSPPSPPSTAIN